MTDDDVTVTACRIADDVIAVSVYVWCPDGCVDWLPSLHNGSIDVIVLEAQLHAHQANTRPSRHPSREW